MKDLVPEIASFVIFIHSDLCLSLRNKRYPSFAMTVTELNHFTTAILTAGFVRALEILESA